MGNAAPRGFVYRPCVSQHADDLELARAASRGELAAVREVERVIGLEASAVARRIDSALGDEIAQATRVRLLVADAAPPRIAMYAGRGPLRAWIGVAALRIALNLKRSARGVASVDVLAELVGAEADSELQHMKTLYRTEFKEALATALNALPERSRAVLRLVYVDGVSLVQLGRLYGVHETTAGRWVERAASEVADRARSHLVEKLALSPSALDSIARMVMSKLELSISSLLRGP